MVALSALLPVDLDSPRASQVYMTDASWYGQGVVTRDLDPASLLRESALAETRGWVPDMDHQYTAGELDTQELAEDVGGQVGACEPIDIGDLTSCARPTRVFLHVYSGRRCPNDLEHYLGIAAASLEGHLLVVSMDASAKPRRGDMTNIGIIDFW